MLIIIKFINKQKRHAHVEFQWEDLQTDQVTVTHGLVMIIYF